jgi:hypothetical protein
MAPPMFDLTDLTPISGNSPNSTFSATIPAVVPGPVAGAGLPGLIGAYLVTEDVAFGIIAFRRRRTLAGYPGALQANMPPRRAVGWCG